MTFNKSLHYFKICFKRGRRLTYSWLTPDEEDTLINAITEGEVEVYTKSRLDGGLIALALAILVVLILA